MPASLRSDYPISLLVTIGPFCPESGATFTGIRIYTLLLAEGWTMFEFILLFVLFYIWHALGVTVGYHRLLSHRSFACPKPVEYFWVMAGYLAFEGSPIWWATIHRAHHRYVDTPLDPHSPRFGFFNAHFGWLLKKGYAQHVDPSAHAKDLLKDKFYLFLEQGGDWHRSHVLVFAIGMAFRLLLLMAFGWVPALASLLAGVAVLQIPLMLNVACHLRNLGYRNFATADDSVNVWWVGILAMGEGWHNNHHAFPGSARSGLKWFEFDLSWIIIRTMKALRLAGRINDMKATRAEKRRHHIRYQHPRARAQNLAVPRRASTY